MSDRATHHDLVGILIRTAKGHHAATEGDNPDWPAWYAEHAVDEINDLLDDEMSVSDLANWLEAADRRYRVEEPEESWPKVYATWLLGGYDN